MTGFLNPSQPKIVGISHFFLRKMLFMHALQHRLVLRVALNFPFPNQLLAGAYAPQEKTLGSRLGAPLPP